MANRERPTTSGATPLDATALPFDRPSDAIEAILGHLTLLGTGRWRLLDASEVSAPADALAITLPGDKGGWWLEPEDGGFEELEPELQGLLIAAARVIATLLVSERNANLATAHAARAEVESTTDELTGVANARSWWRTLAREAARCEEQGLQAVVVVVDLDDLKPVNDELGHLVGDELLRIAGRALQASIRPHDHVARVGGDEFGILVVDREPPDPAAVTARIEAHLAAAEVRASVGAARFVPGDQINEVYHRADREMYRAKVGRRAVA